MSATVMKIALVQMHIEAGNPGANFSKAATLLEQALTDGEKPDVILLPEMWNTGYQLDRIHETADGEGRQTVAAIGGLCRTYGVNIVAGSIALKRGQKVYNATLVFNRRGEVVADYSKIHLFRLMEEEKYLAAGDKPACFPLDGTRCGAVICYDIRFPELARKLALDGARILFVPAEWPNPRLHHWRTLLQARAIENQMYVIACNRVGKSGTTQFFGHSMVVDPWGEVIVEGGEEEAVLRASIHLETVDQVRRTIPVFDDRRPSLY